MCLYHRDFSDPLTYLVEPLILQSRILRPRVSSKTGHLVAEPNLLIPGSFHQYLYRRCSFILVWQYLCYFIIPFWCLFFNIIKPINLYSFSLFSEMIFRKWMHSCLYVITDLELFLTYVSYPERKRLFSRDKKRKQLNKLSI